MWQHCIPHTTYPSTHTQAQFQVMTHYHSGLSLLLLWLLWQYSRWSWWPYWDLLSLSSQDQGKPPPPINSPHYLTIQPRSVWYCWRDPLPRIKWGKPGRNTANQEIQLVLVWEKGKGQLEHSFAFYWLSLSLQLSQNNLPMVQHNPNFSGRTIIHFFIETQLLAFQPF